jgi:hypothetical protein
MILTSIVTANDLYVFAGLNPFPQLLTCWFDDRTFVPKNSEILYWVSSSTMISQKGLYEDSSSGNSVFHTELMFMCTRPVLSECVINFKGLAMFFWQALPTAQASHVTNASVSFHPN